ncbi:hypothetical protein H8957_017785, partial [Semnopithecus entellus]
VVHTNLHDAFGSHWPPMPTETYPVASLWDAELAVGQAWGMGVAGQGSRPLPDPPGARRSSTGSLHLRASIRSRRRSPGVNGEGGGAGAGPGDKDPHAACGLGSADTEAEEGLRIPCPPDPQIHSGSDLSELRGCHPPSTAPEAALSDLLSPSDGAAGAGECVALAVARSVKFRGPRGASLALGVQSPGPSSRGVGEGSLSGPGSAAANFGPPSGSQASVWKRSIRRSGGRDPGWRREVGTWVRTRLCSHAPGNRVEVDPKSDPVWARASARAKAQPAERAFAGQGAGPGLPAASKRGRWRWEAHPERMWVEANNGRCPSRPRGPHYTPGPYLPFPLPFGR